MPQLSCPSCNTAFTVPAIPANRRVTCPRCGDVFPVRGDVAGGAAEAAATAPVAPHPTAAARAVQAKRSVVRTVVIAAAMGLIGLGAGLAVYFTRERPKPPDTTSPPAIVSTATPAAELQGLRYLPADTNVAFALQPGPFLDYAGRTKQDPGELLTRAGLPSKVLGAVGELGLSLPQIDHLAGGTSLGNGALEPRLILVLVLRTAPADEADFLRRVKAKKQSAKDRYDAELVGLPLTLARVSPTVWVFGFDAKKDLAAVDKNGYDAGAKHFPAALAETIATRVPPDSAAWLATNAERWADKPGVQFVIGELMKKKDWLPALAQGRAALAALSFGEEPRVRLFVQTADDAIGDRARAYFKSKAGDKAQHGGAGEYALLDMPIDPATAYATLQQFLGDSAKK